MKTNNKNIQKVSQLANCIRFLAIDAVQKANSGHPGMPMGMADIATVLYEKHLKFDPNDPRWIDRDRFILSNGHGSMLLYACLYLAGYKDIVSKSLGSNTPINMIRATFDGLSKLETKESIAALRDIKVEDLG
mgnify:CR=1 FL=1